MSRTLQVAVDRPGAFPTVTEALETVLGEDCEIVLGPGTYVDNIFLDRVSLTVRAAEGAAKEDVVLSAGTAYEPTVRVRSGSLTLRGITVNGGDSAAVVADDTTVVIDGCALSAPFGPGIRVNDRSRATITDCTVTGSHQGLVIEDSTGTVDRLAVRDTAEDGIVIRLGADPVLRSCSVIGSGHRGVYVYQSGRPTFEGCEIATTVSDGISIAQDSVASLIRVHVHDAQGAGIVFAAGTSGEVDACKVDNVGGTPIDIAGGASVTVTERSVSVGVDAVDKAKGDPEKVQQLLVELETMVGLAGVKAEVKAIIDEIQVNEWRRSAGLSVDGMSNHLIFAGAPGTGKTTVGRIYGQLLAALGVLPGGPLREVSRRDLVGQYIGHTAEKTASVFDEAKGGVVFLDEAYTLSRQSGGGGNDFGQEAIDMIVKLMEDRREEIAVIAAGYTSEMRDFLDANPGLASRFVKTIQFENYEAEELTLILTRMISSGDYLLDPDAEPLLLRHFGAVHRDESFGNARDARKLFELLRKVQSQRLRTLGRQPNLEELQTLTPADIQVATGT